MFSSLQLSFVLTKIFQDIINFGVKFIDLCVCMLFFCFSFPAKKIREHFSKILGDSHRHFSFNWGGGGGESSKFSTHISATAANYEAYQQKLFSSVAIIIVQTTNSGESRQNIKGALKKFREAVAFQG